MNLHNLERLKAAIRGEDKIKNFNMESYFGNCGTSACIAGHCAIMKCCDDGLYRGPNTYNEISVGHMEVANFLDIGLHEAYVMTYPHNEAYVMTYDHNDQVYLDNITSARNYQVYLSNITSDQAIEMLDNFVAAGKVEWPYPKLSESPNVSRRKPC